MVISNKVGNLISSYSQELSRINSKCDNLIKLINMMSSIEDYESNKIIKKSTFGFGESDSKDFKELYSNLVYNRDLLKKIFVDYKVELVKEIKEISKYFELFQREEIDDLNQFKSSFTNYNRNMINFVNDIESKIPGFMNITNSEIQGLFNINLTQSALRFTYTYCDLAYLIQAEAKKEAIFDAFLKVALYLKRYMMDSRTLDRNNQDTFINKLNLVDPNGSYKFAKNFFRFGPDTIFQWISKVLDNVQENKDDSYINLIESNKFKKEDVDKYLKELLDFLFLDVEGLNCVNVEGYDKENQIPPSGGGGSGPKTKGESSSNGIGIYKEKIKIIFKSKTKNNFEKEWNELKNSIFDKLNKYGVFIIDGNNFEEIVFNLKIGKKSIKNIEDEFKDNYSVVLKDIKSILNYEPSFYNFLDLNKHILKIRPEEVNFEVVDEKYNDAINKLKEDNSKLKTELDKLSFVLNILTGQMRN